MLANVIMDLMKSVSIFEFESCLLETVESFKSGMWNFHVPKV